MARFSTPGTAAPALRSGSAAAVSLSQPHRCVCRLGLTGFSSRVSVWPESFVGGNQLKACSNGCSEEGRGPSELCVHTLCVWVRILSSSRIQKKNPSSLEASKSQSVFPVWGLSRSGSRTAGTPSRCCFQVAWSPLPSCFSCPCSAHSCQPILPYWPQLLNTGRGLTGMWGAPASVPVYLLLETVPCWST